VSPATASSPSPTFSSTYCKPAADCQRVAGAARAGAELQAADSSATPAPSSALREALAAAGSAATGVSWQRAGDAVVLLLLCVVARRSGTSRDAQQLADTRTRACIMAVWRVQARVGAHAHSLLRTQRNATQRATMNKAPSGRGG
jgi:hypothetical protein